MIQRPSRGSRRAEGRTVWIAQAWLKAMALIQ